MFDAPGSLIKQVIIDSKVVNKEKNAVYITSDKSQLADKIIADDDNVDLFQEDSNSKRQQMTQI